MPSLSNYSGYDATINQSGSFRRLNWLGSMTLQGGSIVRIQPLSNAAEGVTITVPEEGNLFIYLTNRNNLDEGLLSDFGRSDVKLIDCENSRVVEKDISGYVSSASDRYIALSLPQVSLGAICDQAEAPSNLYQWVTVLAICFFLACLVVVVISYYLKGTL